MYALRRNTNAVFRLVYHVVLVTKFRKKVLTAPMLDRCEALIARLCKAWDGEMLECSGEIDHVHALVDLPPRIGPSKLVNLVKTVTSRELRAEFPTLRAAYRGVPFLWSPSYCILSAGGAPIEVLKRYIEAQDRPPIEWGGFPDRGGPLPASRGRGLPNFGHGHARAS